MITVISKPWSDYELIDSGDEMKLERFGNYRVIRPEPKAIWKKTLLNEWDTYNAIYERSSEGGGQWHYNSQLPPEWTLNWENLHFKIQPTGFKHTGLFPEQAPFWKWIQDTISNAKRPINVLNMFAYTGASTVATLSAGASVTHVDSAKDILTWARRNAELSKVADKQVRWIPEDAIKYVRRELNRGTKYDAIILDPPKFGRGDKNEVWKIEEDLPVLMDLCKQILSERPLFILLNAYAVSFSSTTLSHVLTDTVGSVGKIEHGELQIESKSGRILPASIFARWTSQESQA